MILGLEDARHVGFAVCAKRPLQREPDKDVTRYCRPQRGCEYGAECNVAAGYGHVL